MTINQDAYGHAINGEDTYRFIAMELSAHRPVAMLWADGLGTSISFLFALPETDIPSDRKPWCGLHAAVSPTQAMVVAARGCGMMALPIFQDDMVPLHPDYVAEKLYSFDRSNPTIDRVADLINGVFSALRRDLKGEL